MDILHYFDIDGAKKEILKNQNIDDLLLSSSGMFLQALQKMKTYMNEEEYADRKERGLDVDDIIDTEITGITKHRIGQDVLRDYVLYIYDSTCALCQINKPDLLVCSHIVPWQVDKEID